MTAYHIKIFAPVEVQEPRGAVWAAAAAVSTVHGLRWLTRRLQGSRPAAAATELPRWQSKSARRADSRPLVPHWGTWQ